MNHPKLHGVVLLWCERWSHPTVCVHCLAGKGRTGLMVCAALLRLGVKSSARDAMAFYGEKRVGSGSHVPAQRERPLLTVDGCATVPLRQAHAQQEGRHGRVAATVGGVL